MDTSTAAFPGSPAVCASTACEPFLEAVRRWLRAAVRPRVAPKWRAKSETVPQRRARKKGGGASSNGYNSITEGAGNVTKHGGGRRGAGVVVLSGAGLLAIRPKTEEQASAPKKSPEALAADAMNSGLEAPRQSGRGRNEESKAGAQGVRGGAQGFSERPSN